MAVEHEPKPGDWVRCGDRDNWGQVASRPQNGQILIRWKSRDGSVATKLKPLSVVAEVRRPQGNEGPPQGSPPPVAPGPGRAMKALHRFRKRNGSDRDSERDGDPRASADEPFFEESPEPPAPRPLTPEQIERLERIRSRRPTEATAPRPCWACGGTRFWKSASGALVCGRCHPPAYPHYARAWVDVEAPDGKARAGRESEAPA